jgi:hypothetical protein
MTRSRFKVWSYVLCPFIRVGRVGWDDSSLFRLDPSYALGA